MTTINLNNRQVTLDVGRERIIAERGNGTGWRVKITNGQWKSTPVKQVWRKVGA